MKLTYILLLVTVLFGNNLLCTQLKKLKRIDEQPKISKATIGKIKGYCALTASFGLGALGFMSLYGGGYKSIAPENYFHDQDCDAGKKYPWMVPSQKDVIIHAAGGIVCSMLSGALYAYGLEKLCNLK